MKNSNRYLFMLPTSSIGGAERVTMNLVLHLLSDEKNTVVVILLGGKNLGSWDMTEDFPNLEVIFFHNSNERKGFLLAVQWALRCKSNFDFAFSTHTHVNAFVALLRKVRVLKVNNHIARESTVIFDRFFGMKRLLMKVLYSFYSNINLVICQTPYMKKRFLEEVGCVTTSKVIQLKNPLNLKYISSKTQNADVTDLNLNQGTPTLVQVGRLVDIKNHELTLKALKLVSTKKNFIFLIVGDGPKMKELKCLVKELGLVGSVTFVGQVSNPYSYMAIADIGILSSKKEGFPNVVIEMMAAGTKQIITTNCSDGLNSLPDVKIIESFTPEEFANTIIDSIDSKSDNRVRYKVHASQRDVSIFWNNILCHLELKSSAVERQTLK